MSDARMVEVEVKRYVYLLSVSNEFPEDNIDQLRPVAIAKWRDMASREGYQPLGDPTATLTREVIPRTFPDSDEEMPRRAWHVVGRVLPADVPLPADMSEPRIVIP